MLPERSRDDARCRGCHSPDADAGLAGVTCEACHGPGRLYAARYVMRDLELARAVGLLEPGEKTCLSCHTESTPSLKKFDVKQKLKLMAHPDRPRGTPPQAAAPAK
jgi:formate-dependent nitrite reductase cytochrome c552 subunit